MLCKICKNEIKENQSEEQNLLNKKVAENIAKAKQKEICYSCYNHSNKINRVIKSIGLRKLKWN